MPSHPPRGGRCSDTVRSTLAKVARFQSSAAEMPLAASVMTSRCSSGVIGSPSTSSQRGLVQAVAGPGELKLPAANRQSSARW